MQDLMTVKPKTMKQWQMTNKEERQAQIADWMQRWLPDCSLNSQRQTDSV